MCNGRSLRPVTLARGGSLAGYREHTKQKAANDAVTRLEREVQQQAATVEKVGLRVIEVGASDFLRERLRAEEAKLRDLRHALAKASAPKSPAPTAKVDLSQVLALVAQVEKVAAKSPSRAREVLAGVLEPVTLTPSAEGYEVSLTLRNETAALAGGQTLLWESCGGPQPGTSKSGTSPVLRARIAR